MVPVKQIGMRVFMMTRQYDLADACAFQFGHLGGNIQCLGVTALAARL